MMVGLDGSVAAENSGRQAWLGILPGIDKIHLRSDVRRGLGIMPEYRGLEV